MYNEWANRSEISANLFNPAFLSEITRIFGKEYLSNTDDDRFTFEQIIIALPIILDKQLRESLPKTKATKFHEWIQINGHLIANFDKKVEAILPYIRESVVFSVNHEIYSIDEFGTFELLRTRKPRYWRGMLEETEAIFKAAKFLGRWFTEFPKPRVIFALLGVKP
ncbi:three component ABC system middle component [Neolewinella agarilytica]|uniref:three component ABC system middle component n=1 Tax=Neolewinella agarilytica TaxID=478744 RepID=UPI002352D9A2|nr:three component ABC system middle component [Neolewinella agarilytica]